MSGRSLESVVAEANQALENRRLYPQDEACNTVAEAAQRDMRALSKAGMVAIGPDGWMVKPGDPHKPMHPAANG